MATVDKFGLPIEWASLLMASEQERSDRQGAALKVLHEVFEVAEQRVGEEWSRLVQAQVGAPERTRQP